MRGDWPRDLAAVALLAYALISTALFAFTPTP